MNPEDQKKITSQSHNDEVRVYILPQTLLVTMLLKCIGVIYVHVYDVKQLMKGNGKETAKYFCSKT